MNITFDGVEAETLLLLLDEAGICASAGSACSAGAVEPSHVLLALGLAPAQAKGTLRLTLDAANTAEEIDTAAAVITACAARPVHFSMPSTFRRITWVNIMVPASNSSRMNTGPRK